MEISDSLVWKITLSVLATDGSSTTNLGVLDAFCHKSLEIFIGDETYDYVHLNFYRNIENKLERQKAIENVSTRFFLGVTLPVSLKS